MKQISLCTKQSYGSIFGVDQAWQSNGNKRLTIPKPTIAAGRSHTIGLKSDVQKMRDHLDELKRLGIDAINE